MIQQIINTIRINRNIIPVIGYDALHVKVIEEGNEILIPYLRYLSNKIIKEKGFDNDVRLGYMFNDGGIQFQRVSELLKSSSDFILFSTVFYLLKRISASDQQARRELSTNMKEIHGLVDKELLEKLFSISSIKYCINLTNTTHAFEVIAKNRTIIPQNIVQNFSQFSGRFNTSEPNNDLIKNEFPYDIMLYNLFRNAYDSDQTLDFYRITDDDILEFIPEMIIKQGNSLNNFKEVTKNSSFLFIGCKYPDWVNRLLLYIFKPKLLEGDNNISNFNDDCRDEHHLFFLDKFNVVYQSEENTKMLVDNLYTQLKLNNLTIGDRIKSESFLSYSRENMKDLKNIVSNLFPVMQIWFDRVKMFPGLTENINEDVKLGILNCDVFLPIITQETIYKPENAYVKQEWRFYKDNFGNKPKVIPLVKKGLNLGILGFDIPSTFTNSNNNVFYIEFDDNGLSNEGIAYILNYLREK